MPFLFLDDIPVPSKHQSSHNILRHSVTVSYVIMSCLHDERTVSCSSIPCILFLPLHAGNHRSLVQFYLQLSFQLSLNVPSHFYSSVCQGRRQLWVSGSDILSRLMCRQIYSAFPTSGYKLVVRSVGIQCDGWTGYMSVYSEGLSKARQLFPPPSSLHAQLR